MAKMYLMRGFTLLDILMGNKKQQNCISLGFRLSVNSYSAIFVLMLLTWKQSTILNAMTFCRGIFHLIFCEATNIFFYIMNVNIVQGYSILDNELSEHSAFAHTANTNKN